MYLKTLLSLILLLTFFNDSYAFVFGVNTHGNTSSNTSNTMITKNLLVSRRDLYATHNVTTTRAFAQTLLNAGIKTEAVLQNNYQWDYNCNQNLTTVYNNSYTQTTNIVNNYKDLIFDYELYNEISFRPDAESQVPRHSAQTNAAIYEGKSCFDYIAAFTKGMADAIQAIKVSSGYPLRVILGVTSRDFALATFLKSKGVKFDVIGWHSYPHATTASELTDTWYGAGGPYYQLSLLTDWQNNPAPITYNEHNCGEIYDSTYDNQPTSAKTIACYAAYKKHIKNLFSTNNVLLANNRLERVVIYELYDEPSKAGAEGRFGLMYTETSPKLHLNIIAAFAGGTLSASERTEVINSGVLTGTEIDAYYALAHPSDPPPDPEEPPPVVPLTQPVGLTIISE